jgi:hypothetical protein
MQRKPAAHPAIEAARERAQRAKYAALTAHYGKIGSGAVNAALICAHEYAQKPGRSTPKPA